MLLFSRHLLALPGTDGCLGSAATAEPSAVPVAGTLQPHLLGGDTALSHAPCWDTVVPFCQMALVRAPGWLLAEQIQAQSILQSRNMLSEMRCQVVERFGCPRATTAGLEAGGRAAQLFGGPELGASTVLHLWQCDPPSPEPRRSWCCGWAELAASCPCRAFWVGRSSRVPGGGGEGGHAPSRGSLRCSFWSAAGGGGKQLARKGSRRVPPRLSACLAACRFLLDQGRRRLEVTLRDGVPLWPSSESADCLARDGPGFALAGIKPHEIKGLPYPKPCCFGDVVIIQGPAPGCHQLRWHYPKPAASMHLFR